MENELDPVVEVDERPFFEDNEVTGERQLNVRLAAQADVVYIAAPDMARMLRLIDHEPDDWKCNIADLATQLEELKVP